MHRDTNLYHPTHNTFLITAPGDSGVVG